MALVVSMREWPKAMKMLLFAALWSVPVGGGCLALICHWWSQLAPPGPPTWLPAPGLRQPHGTGIGTLVFDGLLVIALVLAWLCLVFWVAAELVGRIAIEVRGDQSEVRTSIGPFSSTRRFDADRVNRVSIQGRLVRYRRSSLCTLFDIVITHSDGISLSFGSELPPERIEFTFESLRSILLDPRTHSSPST